MSPELALLHARLDALLAEYRALNVRLRQMCLARVDAADFDGVMQHKCVAAAGMLGAIEDYRRAAPPRVAAAAATRQRTATPPLLEAGNTFANANHVINQSMVYDRGRQAAERRKTQPGVGVAGRPPMQP